MKQINLNKKLVFEKKTVSEINSAEMAQIHGAGITAGCTDGCTPLQTMGNCSLTNCSGDCTIGTNTNITNCKFSDDCDYTKNCFAELE